MNNIRPTVLIRANINDLPVLNNIYTKNRTRDLTEINFNVDGLRANPIVMSLIKRRTTALKQAPLVLATADKPTEIIPYNNKIPLYKLLYNWDYNKTYKDLISEIEEHILLSGNAYIHALRDSKRNISNLKVYGSFFITPQVDENGNILNYMFDNGSIKKDIPLEDIIHIRECLIDITKPWVGIPLLLAGGFSIDASNASQQLAVSLIKKGVLPSYVVKVPNGAQLSEQNADRIKEALSTRLQGKNNGNVAILNEGVGVEKLENNLADLLTSPLENLPQAYLSELLGVPIMMTNFPAGENQKTYLNYASASKSLFLEIKNRWDVISESLTRYFENESNVVFPNDNTKYKILFDTSNIAELKIDYEQEIDQWKNSAISLDEFREVTNQSPFPDPKKGAMLFAEIEGQSKPQLSLSTSTAN